MYTVLGVILLILCCLPYVQKILNRMVSEIWKYLCSVKIHCTDLRTQFREDDEKLFVAVSCDKIRMQTKLAIFTD